jgi:hypothetical protein
MATKKHVGGVDLHVVYFVPREQIPLSSIACTLLYGINIHVVPQKPSLQFERGIPGDPLIEYHWQLSHFL